MKIVCKVYHRQKNKVFLPGHRYSVDDVVGAALVADFPDRFVVAAERKPRKPKVEKQGKELEIEAERQAAKLEEE